MRTHSLTRPVLLVLLTVVLAAGCASYSRQAGSGDIAFRLAWNGHSDLDLFVQDPAGECIYFGHREAASAGLLDVDCNANPEAQCAAPVENVYWPTDTAPAGEYRLWVHAHALLPDEIPVAYQAQILRGERLFWTSTDTLEGRDLVGPFVYDYPGGTVRGPVDGIPLPTICARAAGIFEN